MSSSIHGGIPPGRDKPTRRTGSSATASTIVFPNGASDIGILEADKPEGPYRDLIGRPLITRQTPNSNVQWLFDPGVFVDDDNTLYVYFGGGGPGNARVIKLADDLRSTVGSAITIDAPHFFSKHRTCSQAQIFSCQSAAIDIST